MHEPGNPESKSGRTAADGTGAQSIGSGKESVVVPSTAIAAVEPWLELYILAPLKEPFPLPKNRGKISGTLAREGVHGHVELAVFIEIG